MSDSNIASEGFVNRTFVKLTSSTTQDIDSNLSLQDGSQILAADGTSDHSLLGYHDYHGWDAVEVGNEDHPLTLNGSYLAAGASLDGRILYNYKDNLGTVQADAIPLLSKDIGPILTRVSALEAIGVFVGSFPTHADLIAGGGPPANLNDYADVQVDEDHNGQSTRYIKTSNNPITWTFDFAFSSDISGKMNVVSGPTANNILLTNSTGQAIDSGRNLTAIDNAINAIPIVSITNETGV